MNTESTDRQRSRLYWQCRRGMLELDILLQAFCRDHLQDNELAIFAELLTCSDDQLYAYLMGRVVPFDPTISALVSRIRNTPDDNRTSTE